MTINFPEGNVTKYVLPTMVIYRLLIILPLNRFLIQSFKSTNNAKTIYQLN